MKKRTKQLIEPGEHYLAERRRRARVLDGNSAPRTIFNFATEPELQFRLQVFEPLFGKVY